MWKEYSWVANDVRFNTLMVSGGALRVNPANECGGESSFRGQTMFPRGRPRELLPIQPTTSPARPLKPGGSAADKGTTPVRKVPR